VLHPVVPFEVHLLDVSDAQTLRHRWRIHRYDSGADPDHHAGAESDPPSLLQSKGAQNHQSEWNDNRQRTGQEMKRVRRDEAVAKHDPPLARLRDVVLVRPGSLPKTSSGKLQRSLCRDRYFGAELENA